tara:strand:+ start:233 stop:1162 length:930 start_codon:yes stop_codon:yes gene_type:complete
MELENMFYILEKEWYTLQKWAKMAHDEDKNEISGLMTAVPQKDGRFKLDDVEILKQENTSTNTELDGDAVSAYMMKYGMKYNNPDMKFVWWHSHHTMEAFWSGTDTNEIDAWKNNSFSLALVINLREEYVFRVSVWKANGLPIQEHYDTNLTIERNRVAKVPTTKDKNLYKELCSSPTITHYNTYKGHYNMIAGNPRQSHLWKNEKELKMEDSYAKALEKAESIQDSFMDGTLKLSGWNKEVKEVNKVCKENKFPFKMIEWKLNKHDLQSKLMTCLPDELFEWDDNAAKERAETMAWNNSFGYGGGNVY